MFDKYYGRQYTSVDVTEKRAPTDDSIRLYGEMLDKARAEILRTLPIDNQLLNACAIQRRDALKTYITAEFRLNGAGFQVSVSFTDLEMLRSSESSRSVRALLVERLSSAIAVELLKHMVKHAE